MPNTPPPAPAIPKNFPPPPMPGSAGSTAEVSVAAPVAAAPAVAPTIPELVELVQTVASISPTAVTDQQAESPPPIATAVVPVAVPSTAVAPPVQPIAPVMAPAATPAPVAAAAPAPVATAPATTAPSVEATPKLNSLPPASLPASPPPGSPLGSPVVVQQAGAGQSVQSAQPVQPGAPAPAPVQAPAPPAPPTPPVPALRPQRQPPSQPLAPSPGPPAMPGPPDIAPVDIPESTDNMTPGGHKILIFGDTGMGKTTSLRNLHMARPRRPNGARVLYFDLDGNFASIENLVPRSHWKVLRPVSFDSLVRDIYEYTHPTNSPWPFDILVFDHGTKVESIFIQKLLGQGATGGQGLYEAFATLPSNLLDAKAAPEITQGGWGKISSKFSLFIDKTNELTFKEHGSKDVVWIFQEGSDYTTGKIGPQAVGQLTRKLPNKFNASLRMLCKNQDYFFQTWNDGATMCKHTYNVPGVMGGSPDDELVSILLPEEPADLGKMLAKIESYDEAIRIANAERG